MRGSFNQQPSSSGDHYFGMIGWKEKRMSLDNKLVYPAIMDLKNKQNKGASHHSRCITEVDTKPGTVLTSLAHLHNTNNNNSSMSFLQNQINLRK